ncbi:MAG: RNA polymerase sigma factor [Chitinophagaceae bacterium]
MNEQQLIIALQQGQEPAFARLVADYQPMVYNTVLGLVQQAEDAEDLAQEVFIKVHQSISSFKGESKLSTWIYRICITKSLDYVKYRQRKKRFGFIHSIFGSKEETVPQLADFHHPGVQLANKERAALLFKAIHLLPENQRVAFVLQKLEGLGQMDIAAIMKQSEGAVESLLQRAKQNLRKSLGEYYQSS